MRRFYPLVAGVLAGLAMVTSVAHAEISDERCEKMEEYIDSAEGANPMKNALEIRYEANCE